LNNPFVGDVQDGDNTPSTPESKSSKFLNNLLEGKLYAPILRPKQSISTIWRGRPK
jgi:hypothetical protein